MSFMTLKNVWVKALAKNSFKKIFMDFLCFSNLRARFCARFFARFCGFFFAFFFFLTFFLFFFMRCYNFRDAYTTLRKFSKSLGKNFLSQKMALSTYFANSILRVNFQKLDSLKSFFPRLLENNQHPPGRGFSDVNKNMKDSLPCARERPNKESVRKILKIINMFPNLYVILEIKNVNNDLVPTQPAN